LRHLHLHRHHAGSDHAQGEAHRHQHPGRRALLVGLAHGLAGSATLAVLVAAATPSRVTGILFLGVFGAGAAAAMALATAVIALPLRRPAANRSAAPGRGLLWLRAGGAVVSIAVGASMIASWLGG
jgi:sulfite exporter TauE/SafE